MPDMLVKLYELPDSTELYKSIEAQDIRIIRPMTPNQTPIRNFIVETFGTGWADEISTAFTRFPVCCFIAYDNKEKRVIGFAGYDCTCKGFFGPTGVHPDYRGKGLGKALLLKCLEAMREEGYDVTYTELQDGHTFQNTRVRLAVETLQFLSEMDAECN